MDNEYKLLAELKKFFGDGLASVGSFKNELEAMIRSKIENYLSQSDFVTKEEYLVLQDMVSKLRIDQEEMKKALTKLDKQDI